VAGRKRKKRWDPLARCFSKWRVDYEPLLSMIRRQWPAAVERVKRELRGLEEALNSDRGAARRLLREPVVAETSMGPVRRYRVSTPAGWLRLLFIVDINSCTVVFTDVELRDEETYRRLRRRLR